MARSIHSRGLQSVGFALVCAAALWAAPSHALIVTGQLTGDIRDDAPDDLIVNVTIRSGGDAGLANNQSVWTVDINSPAHPDIKLDEFYFNLAGAPADYAFAGIDPAGWAISSPGTVRGAGTGGDTFMFQVADPPGQPIAPDIANSQILSFVMTYLGGDITADLFTGAADTSGDAGIGQMGAHLQSLTVNSDTCPQQPGGGRCSDSGFAFGSFAYEGPPVPPAVPSPAPLALLGFGGIVLGWLRRRYGSKT